jgi:transcriptional regulator with XRE-family HTH domain
MTMSFANWLEKSLTDRRLRPTALARLLEVDPSTVARWLSGQTKPHFATLPRLAAVLGVDPALVYAVAGHPADLGTSQGLTPEEIELLAYFRRLSDEQKRIVLAAARGGVTT